MQWDFIIGTNEARFPEHSNLNFTKRGTYLWPRTQLLSFSKASISYDIKEIIILNRTQIIKEKVWESRFGRLHKLCCNTCILLQYWTPYEINFIIHLVFFLGLHKKDRKLDKVHLYVTI